MGNFLRKHKIVVTIFSVLLIGALVFLIYWNATAFDRHRQYYMDDLDEDLTALRNHETFALSWFIPDDLMEDAEYQKFLVETVNELFDSKENRILYALLRAIEYDTQYNSQERGMYRYLLDAVTNNFNAVTNPEDAIEILDELQTLEYFNSGLILSLDSDVISSYISENGTNSFITTPGKGFYANEEDSSSHKQIGITGSNLYEAESATYLGDFKISHSSGVRLNRSTYKEESYSNETYAFRGNSISFNPSDGNCIWSGEYLFCFDSDGILLGFEKLSVNTTTMDDDYNNAVALMEAENYEEAIAAFEILDGYKDSVDKIAVCHDMIQEEIYCEAVALMDAGKLREACTVFNYIASYKDSAEKAKAAYAQYMTNKQQTFEVGRYVSFGAIEQDNDLSNGIEDIEWLVLAKEDNRVLVISRYGLFPVSYNNTRTNVTWESCTLRQWLNSDFLNGAFLVQEQEQIPTVTVVAQAREGNDTQDKIFLLNVAEAEQYLGNSDGLNCQATEYAAANGARVSDSNGNCNWWLRTPGKEERDLAVYVNDMGGIARIGGMVHIIEFAIRPAMWITIP